MFHHIVAAPAFDRLGIEQALLPYIHIHIYTPSSLAKQTPAIILQECVKNSHTPGAIFTVTKTQLEMTGSSSVLALDLVQH